MGMSDSDNYSELGEIIEGNYYFPHTLESLI